MKIAVVVRSLKYGGMERAACNQVDAFVQSGHKADLIYFSNKDKQIEPREKNVNVIQIDINALMKSSMLGKIWDLFARVANILFRKTYPIVKGVFTSKIFKEEFSKLETTEKYDLILIRGQGTFEQIWQFKDLRSVRICVNVSKKIDSSWIDKLMSRCYYNDVRINCNSTGSKEFYIEKFQRENIHPISLESIKNPFFVEKVLELSNHIIDDIPSQKYILGLGRLVSTKNFELLIDSFVVLKDKYNIEHKLVIVGDGEQKEYLKSKCINLGIDNDVIFTGYQSNPYPWITSSDMIVFTSKKEGLSNVLIEAMCCKTRIVITESPGGMIEMMQGKLKDYIAKNDKEDISYKVNKSLLQPKEYFYDDYNNALMQFNPKNVVEEWINMYIKKNNNV